MSFDCVCCGTIDESLVVRDKSDIICTLCGTVAPDCPWEPSNVNTFAIEMIDSNISKTCRRIVQDLELEPHDEWCAQLTNDINGPCTAKNVCRAIVSRLERMNVSVIRVLEYARFVHQIDTASLFENEHTGATTTDTYYPLIVRLSERVELDHVSRRVLHNKILSAVRSVPSLDYKLPNSVVMAVWLKHFGNNTESLSDVCSWMNIKIPTVKRVLATLI